MRFINNVSATALLSAILQLGSTVATDSSSGSLKIDFNVKREVPKGDIVKRDDPEGAVVMKLMNHKTLYIAELYIGSNEDKVHVHVDTGSSDLWVPASDVTCSKENPLAALGEGDDDDDDDENSGEGEQPSETQGGPSRGNKRDEGQIYSSLYPSGHPQTTNLPGAGNPGFISNSSNTAAGESQSSESLTCTAHGSFNTEASDTFETNNTIPFYAAYGDGTYAFGDWGQDTIKIGNASVHNASFAIANATSNDIGVFGIGLRGLESTSSFGYFYDSLPYKMKSNGVINKVLYSLYLNNINASTGSVLFGAIDHAKHEGHLETLPVVKGRDGTFSDLAVELKHVALNHEGDKELILQNSTIVILDSGSTISYLTSHQVKSLGEALDGEFIESQGAFKVDCELQNSNSTMDFTFGNSDIHVPLSELIMPENETSCYLGILPSQKEGNETETALFGDNILRSAYIVYDLEDLQVQIAQARYTDEEDIRVVGGKESTSGSSGSNSSSNGTTSGGVGSSSSTEHANSGFSIYNLPWVSVLAGLATSLALV
ncbi:Candidapepsin-9 [Candida parapsilosis]|nr:Candidapepsin-9 [Candida parapsilosis]